MERASVGFRVLLGRRVFVLRIEGFTAVENPLSPKNAPLSLTPTPSDG